MSLIVDSIFLKIYLIILCSAYLLGYLILRKKSDNHRFYIVVKKYHFWIFLSLFCILKFGFIHEMLFEIIKGSWRTWAYNNAINRYSTNIDYGIFFNLGTSVFFVFMFIAGVSKFKLVNFICIFFTLIVEISTLAKLSLIIGFIFFFIGFLYSRNLKSNKLNFFVQLPIYMVLTVVVLMSVQYLRVSHENNSFQTLLFVKLPVYTVAHYKAFELWSHFYDGSMMFGYNTFAAIPKLFGYKLKQGMFDFINTNYGKTNVYTVLRVLIMDFGWFYTIFIYLFLGFLTKLIKNLSNLRFSFFIDLVLILFFSFPFTSLFTFTTVLIASLILPVIIIISK